MSLDIIKESEIKCVLQNISFLAILLYFLTYRLNYTLFYTICTYYIYYLLY